MDTGLLSPQPKQPESSEIQKVTSKLLLWYIGTDGILFYSTQGPQGSWW